ncbi:hypothetical protein [Streptomyces sp. 8N616]|uniref:hypothetical protein n=1 Tax=Streptomyces sp. 8N616 TaxID=3457414 RepID=UPI003FD06417
MLDQQLPDDVAEFADYLHQLLGALDPEAGWYGVFAQRDPDGIRACLEGSEVLPWDVVESLFQDLAVRHGAPVADRQRARAEQLHRASVAAYDRWIGGREALLDRLDVMLRENSYAAARERELSAALASAGSRAEAERLEAELAWAQDDRERATARCAELRARLATLEDGRERGREHGGEQEREQEREQGREQGRDPGVVPGDHRPGQPRPDAAGEAVRVPHPREARHHHEHEDSGREPEQPSRGAPDPGRPPKRAVASRGARFAGIEDTDKAGPAAVPATPEAAAPAPAKPRGARFAGAYETPKEPRPPKESRAPKEPRAGKRGGRDRAPKRAEAAPQDSPDLAAARRATDEAVARLAALRASERGGEAYVVLCEAVAGPAEQLPLLVAGLERSGLAADVATLLWEASCLPPQALAAAAVALTDGDRTGDCRTLLRQAVARPAPELADTLIALCDADRADEADTLLDALLRARTPEEVARVAEADPEALVPMVLDAATGVSTHRQRDVALAMRIAGLQGVPDAV